MEMYTAACVAEHRAVMCFMSVGATGVREQHAALNASMTIPMLKPYDYTRRAITTDNENYSTTRWPARGG